MDRFVCVVSVEIAFYSGSDVSYKMNIPLVVGFFERTMQFGTVNCIEGIYRGGNDSRATGCVLWVKLKPAIGIKSSYF